MRTLTLTDAEVQKLIASAIRKRLKAAGFHTGTASDDHSGFFFPIDLGLAGQVGVTRHEDGTWTIQQETNLMLAERMGTTLAAHGEAIAAATQRFEEG